jgi:hypothetical protein
LASGKKGIETPPPLLLAWWCGANHLPSPGGMLDQDYKTMMQMRALSNVHDAVRTSRAAIGPDIHKLPVGVKKIIKSLIDQGLY